MPKTVLILGASGKIGRHSAQAFESAGWRVRLYDRKRGNMRAAATGADVIVNGLNPPNYHNWAELIPRITEQVIDAARHSGATVIVPGNVYNFGATPGVWSELTPHRPVSRKGRIREEMEQTYRESGVRTIVLRAGNFIDPNRQGDVMSLVLLRRISRGYVTYPGSPAVRQAWCYVPDWARAAVALAERRETLATFEDVPFAGLTFSAEELARLFSEILNREITVRGFPWFAMRALAPFWELARELLDMRYLWNTSHSLDGRKFASLVPDFEATSMQAAVLSALPPDVYPDECVTAAASRAVAR